MFRLISLCLLLVTSSAIAHARLKTPVPRNNSDLLKDPNGPCGNVPRTPNNTVYTQGQVINVTFEETVNHNGCFAFALSTANDQNFTFLKMVPHSNVGTATSAAPRQYATTIQLPANTVCQNCTLQQIQYMIAGFVAGDVCPPANPPAGSRYFSCADIRIVARPDAGTGAGGGAGGGSGAGGGAAGGGAGGAGGGSAGGGAGGSGGAGGGDGTGGGTAVVADAGATGGGTGATGGGTGMTNNGTGGGTSGGLVSGEDPGAGCSAMPIGGLAALGFALVLRRRRR